MHQDEEIAERRDGDRIAEIGRVILRNERASHHDAGPGALAENARATIGKSKGTDQHLYRSGHHQGDDGQIQPTHSQSGKPDDQADERRGNASRQQRQFEWRARAVRYPQCEPAADAEQAELRQRNHAKLRKKNTDAEARDHQRDNRDQHPEPIAGHKRRKKIEGRKRACAESDLAERQPA